MWTYEYADYPPDKENKAVRIETGRGIVGIEMKEQHGWGLAYQTPRIRRRWRPIRSLLALFGKKWEE